MYDVRDVFVSARGVFLLLLLLCVAILLLLLLRCAAAVRHRVCAG